MDKKRFATREGIHDRAMTVLLGPVEVEANATVVSLERFEKLEREAKADRLEFRGQVDRLDEELKALRARVARLEAREKLLDDVVTASGVGIDDSCGVDPDTYGK